MMQETHAKLVQKTNGNLENLQLCAKVLQTYKQNFSHHQIMAAYLRIQPKMKSEFEVKSYPLDKRFDQILKKTKSKNFNLENLIKQVQNELSDYYKEPNEQIEEQEQISRELPTSNKAKKTKKIQKNKHQIRKSVKLQSQIYEDSEDQQKQFMI